MPILPRLSELHADMVLWRRDIHAHPELAYEEHRTSDLVAGVMAGCGIEVHRGLGGTGVVGVIRGRQPGERAIGLRADMDALPMPEANDFAHASCNHGKMHACGHDGHTTMLLGAARALAESRNFKGTVYAIFQPAEEGKAGAQRMIDDGLFTRFPMDEIYGLHNWPEMPAGRIAVHPGPVMAAADHFTVTVSGLGTHAAMPHRGVDPVLVASHIVTAAQSLVSRGTDPLDAAVLSITWIEAGTTFNVIPSEARLHGTIRSFRPDTRERLHAQFSRLVDNVAAAFGANAELELDPGYPPTVNSAPEAQSAARAAALVVGDANVDWAPPPSMAAEDFGYMLQQRPGCYIWLGQGEAEPGAKLHNPRYDFNDAMLPVGASYWVTLAETLLPLD